MKTSIEFESKTITISSRHIGIDSPEWAHGYKKHHYKVKVSVPYSTGQREYTTDYWCNTADLKKRDLYEILETLCCDATYGDMSIDDFNSEMCYEKVSECIRAYNGCKETYEAFKNMFLNPYSLGDYLREKYDL